jgi:FkbM family methyltransferase
MIKKKILKALKSLIKFILPFFSKLFIVLKVNKRIANFLNEKSFLANNYYNFSEFLENLNKNEKIIALDIGAQGGFNSDLFFPKKYNKFFQPILVEPIKEEAEKLKEKFKFVIDKGLWSSDMKKKIFILGNRLGSSSMYEPDKSVFDIHKIKKKDYANFDVTKISEVECITLDDALSKINIDNLDYLKIDTQGSEYEILKGMKNYFPLLIRAEVHLFSMYKNVPSWTDLLGLLNQKNYLVCDWKAIGSHKTKIPAEMDVIFIPNYKKQDGIKLIEENKEKFISLMLIFGQINLLKIIIKELNLSINFPINNFEDRTFF